MKACGLSQELRLITTQTRGLTDYGVKRGNPVVLFLEPKMLRYTHCETGNCRRMRRDCVSPHALKDYSLTYHTDGHGVRTILTLHKVIVKELPGFEKGALTMAHIKVGEV